MCAACCGLLLGTRAAHDNGVHNLKVAGVGAQCAGHLQVVVKQATGAGHAYGGVGAQVVLDIADVQVVTLVAKLAVARGHKRVSLLHHASRR